MASVTVLCVIRRVSTDDDIFALCLWLHNIFNHFFFWCWLRSKSSALLHPVCFHLLGAGFTEEPVSAVISRVEFYFAKGNLDITLFTRPCFPYFHHAHLFLRCCRLFFAVFMGIMSFLFIEAFFKIVNWE